MSQIFPLICLDLSRVYLTGSSVVEDFQSYFKVVMMIEMAFNVFFPLSSQTQPHHLTWVCSCPVERHRRRLRKALTGLSLPFPASASPRAQLHMEGRAGGEDRSSSRLPNQSKTKALVFL